MKKIREELAEQTKMFSYGCLAQNLQSLKNVIDKKKNYQKEMKKAKTLLKSEVVCFSDIISKIIL